MFKKIAILAVLGVIFYSCSQAPQPTEDTQVYKIAELVAEPLGFDGKEVTFEGTITHICRHSGNKMRVNQLEDADFSIMVMLEEFQTQFSPDFEGRNVKVTGLLKTSVRNIDQLEEDHEGHDHEGEEGHGCSSTEEAVKRMQERGITPDIIAFIEMTGFEIIEVAAAEEAEAEEEVIEIAEV
ncbi:MAG: hypothetical protein K0B37_02215 [Bacteroidales bacterium]|nr:hypothetical protein [Bacteroidales bacterium]